MFVESTGASEQPRFAVGQIVALRSNVSVSGAVVGVTHGGSETRYQVFANGRSMPFYESQLVAVESDLDEAVLPVADFQARLTALQINQPSLSNLYSLHAARVNFVPYQFRPVLKFIRADRPRLLIADEVGVGKTIEAGLILRELQSRREIRSVLIICPKPLVTERKWQLEMERFDEQFTHLDGATLRHCLSETDRNGAWPDRHLKCILPFSLFDELLLHGGEGVGGRSRVGLMGLDPPPRFDLVIVDEAHHLRNSATYLHQGVRYFLDNSDAAVLLTATPIQLESDDLFVLLNLLRPDTIIDRGTFAQMSAPNEHINEAVALARTSPDDWQERAADRLESAASTAWGEAVLRPNPEFQSLIEGLRGSRLASEERLRLMRRIEETHTFANVINRTRRRDIGTYFTTRKPESVSVEFTEPQQQLHDALLAAQERILQQTHGMRSVRFLMSTLRRQAASCLYGLAPLIETILSRRLDELELDELDMDDGGDFGSLGEHIQTVLTMAQELDERDPKLDALMGIVEEKLLMPNNKMLLFSSFRHTLRYLLEKLSERRIRVGLIHGEVDDEERRELRRRFSLPKEDQAAIDLLLSSEVGCEGLDYQFCDCMVNYDLPWNPMRVEQRIGRIDRYGQQSETVAIWNLVTPGTVDFDIYHRCLLRIGVFRQALGGSEEILGSINAQIRTVAESLELTDAERQDRLQQIADNNIRILQEQERLEEQQTELFGIVLPPQQIEQEVELATSPWLTPASLLNLTRIYATTRCGGDDHIVGDGPQKTLRLGQDSRQRLLEDFKRLTRSVSPVYRSWENWLKGADSRLEITFDSAAAAANRNATFVTPIHPLALQAAQQQVTAPPFRTAFLVTDDSVAPGTYPFVVYQWERTGLRDDSLLQVVCADRHISARIMEMIQRAKSTLVPDIDISDDEVFRSLDATHHRLWSVARDEHQRQTRQIANYRRESLRASHTGSVAILREQAAQASDERIMRMRESQVARQEADYQRRLVDIDEAPRRADIRAQEVAYGMMVVEATS